MQMHLAETFRKNLIALMDEQGISARALETATEVHHVTISRIRNGKLTNLTMDVCERLAEGLGVPPQQMFAVAPAANSRRKRAATG
jgi:transcriptional regulator with XRE-family HTH domain